MKMVKRIFKSEAAFHLVFILFCLSILVPFMLVISISLSDEGIMAEHGYSLIPESISFYAYKIFFLAPTILLRAYANTIIITVTGTVLGLLLTAMLAYALSRRDYRYRRVSTLLIFFTLLFNGGLVPFYILVTQYLHLKDTLWAVILPVLINPFFVIVMKGFLEQLPMEIMESAKIDGAGELRIFFTIVLPLSTPALTTVGLFISFGYWNELFLGLLFIDNPKLVPLQLMLFNIFNKMEFLSKSPQILASGVTPDMFPSLSARMALALLAVGPMLCVFPFFQRFFVKGLTVGSVKA
jgi:putative aldouronate transport system permease protein